MTQHSDYRFTRLVTIDRLTVTCNDIGDEIEIWENIGGFWADVKFVRGSEGLSGGVIQVSQTILVTVRHHAAGGGIFPTAEDRLRLDLEDFNITKVHDRDGRGRFLTIEAVSGGRP